MVGQLRHANVKWACWKRPQRHYFIITKQSSKRFTVGGIWCVEEVSDHHGQKTGIKCDSSSCRKKWIFVSGSSLRQRFSRRNEETAWKRKRIERSLVIVIVMFYVLTCVVSSKLFWNWIGVVQFVSHDAWFHIGLVIWSFLNYCFEQILLWWSGCIGIRLIFTINELVDRLRNLN